MASNKKITDLDEISSITVADDDVLAIVDVSQNKTYKIRKDAFEVAISGVSSMAASSPLVTNASTGAVVMTLDTVPIAKGGTGGVTNSEARTNLGLGTISTQDADSVSVTGGSLSGMTSVGTTTLTATGTSTLSTVDINGGAIDNTAIGAGTKSTGAFTTLSATGGYTGSVTGNVTGNVDGNLTGNVTGNLTGNVTASTGTSTFSALSTSGNASLTSLTLAGTAVTSTAAELNILDGVTASTAELNILDGITSSTAELNTLDGYTGNATHLNYAKDLYNTGVTTTEFDYLDGVTGTLWNNGNSTLFHSSANQSNGYVKLPNGLYIQWGYNYSTSGGTYVAFPLSFPSYCFSVMLTLATAYNDPANPILWCATNITKSGFDTQSTAELPAKMWLAIGF